VERIAGVLAMSVVLSDDMLREAWLRAELTRQRNRWLKALWRWQNPDRDRAIRDRENERRRQRRAENTAVGLLCDDSAGRLFREALAEARLAEARGLR
jgi:hypothetical protein